MVRPGGPAPGAPGPGQGQPACQGSPMGVADSGAAGGGIDSERHILRDHGPSAHIAAHFGRAFPGKGVPGLDELKNWKSHAYFFRNPLILLL